MYKRQPQDAHDSDRASSVSFASALRRHVTDAANCRRQTYAGGANGVGLEDFDATDFEQFCFELLSKLDGFRNVEWRKGTPKQSSDDNSEHDILSLIHI